MPEVFASVATASASRYLQQLAKHWSHKFDVTFDAHHAEIPLPFGRCLLDAAPDQLRVHLIGVTDADMARFEQVVADHLARFAFRETLVFDWKAA